jgi:formylglycine-generating enzyme required for sulfatase activity
MALTLNADYTVVYTININAGTATVNISGTGNYAGSSGSGTFIINKAPGATVGAPSGTLSVTSSSITINAVSVPGNGQIVEYAINTTNTVPSSGWQDNIVFNGLNACNVYYIFARSKENTNYNAGTPSVSLQIITSVEMVYVPGGSFQMGNPQNSYDYIDDDERPVHTVTLSSFYMGKYEVTQAQYQAVIGDLPYYLKKNPKGVGDNYPVYCVNWYDAIVFCNKLSIAEGLTPAYRISGSTNPSDWGIVPHDSNISTWDAAAIVAGSNGYRLPTEAQWEYAAKSGNGTPGNYRYSGSNTIGDVAWYMGNSGGNSHEVGKKQPNGLGIYDMSGNVREWCWDLYGSYSSVAQTDPQGATSGTRRVQRGGDWDYGSTFASTVRRVNINPYGSGNNDGFRLVRP